MFMSIVCLILIFLSTFIRICITLDTIEKENAYAAQQEKEGEPVESFSNDLQGGTTDDPDPTSEESGKHVHKKLRASKYENTQIIWFATNSQGEQPLLIVPILFIGLCFIMVMCLYYFYKFQEYQEELAAAIEDSKMLKDRQDKGLAIVMEQDD